MSEIPAIIPHCCADMCGCCQWFVLINLCCTSNSSSLDNMSNVIILALHSKHPEVITVEPKQIQSRFWHHWHRLNNVSKENRAYLQTMGRFSSSRWFHPHWCTDPEMSPERRLVSHKRTGRWGMEWRRRLYKHTELTNMNQIPSCVLSTAEL